MTASGCSTRCLFSSPSFLQFLDRVGLKSPPRTNFSPEFLAQYPELVAKLPLIHDVFSLTENERVECANRIYSKLSPGETRLLCLKAGAWQDTLECSLIPYTVGDWIPYRALSYTWGKPVFTSRVVCNGVDYTATQNLSDALRYLRDEKTDRLLWVDALCINQADLDEKTYQIPQMYRIYENAESTVIWLGVANEKDTVMLSQLEEIADTSAESLTGRHRGTCVDVFVQMHDWCAKFLQRAWFTRSWIRQEIAASGDCVMMCGGSSVDFTKLERGVRRFLDVEADLPRGAASMPVDTTVAAVRFNRLLQQRDDLQAMFARAYDDAKLEGLDTDRYLPGYICRRWFRLVLQGSIFAATDARDKVFSMTAALEKAAHPSTSLSGSKILDIVSEYYLSYKMSISMVYQNFLKGLINTSKTLEVLSFFRPSYKIPTSGLPTWVSDLRTPEGGCLATGRISTVGLAEPQTLSSEFSPLHVRGTVLGQIGKNIDYDPRTQELVRVQLDDLEPLDLYESNPLNHRSLSKLWENGEPMDHILGGMGFGMFQLDVDEHAKSTLGLDADFVVIQATQDAEAGDIVICAYGAFHPLVVRKRPEWIMHDCTPVQQFCGPSIIWQQIIAPQTGFSVSSATDRVAASIGFARWKPIPGAMQERKLGIEEDFSLF